MLLETILLTKINAATVHRSSDEDQWTDVEEKAPAMIRG